VKHIDCLQSFYVSRKEHDNKSSTSNEAFSVTSCLLLEKLNLMTMPTHTKTLLSHNKTTTYTLTQLAALIPDATVHGNGSLVVTALVHPQFATHATEMIYIATESAFVALETGAAKVGLLEASLPIPEALLQNNQLGFLVVKRGKVGLAHALRLFEKPAFVTAGIHPTAQVEASAIIGENVTIGAFCVVGEHTVIGAGSVLHPHVLVGANVVMGENCLLHKGVFIGDYSQLGNRIIIQPNAVIGADGFSYVTPEAAKHEKSTSETQQPSAVNDIIRINSVGWVVLEDDVEVGACTTIDRGTLAETRIGKGTKLDNLVMIGHNNTIGNNCLIVSQVGLAGSCRVGNGVVIAGQAGLADHLTIGDNAIIMARSAVMRDVDPSQVVVGTPAMPSRQFMEQILHIGKLKEMMKAFKALQKEMLAMKEKASQFEALFAAFSSDADAQGQASTTQQQQDA
jgi:UDP-3-O-[3-hydroxymyristoyl] glucosamine N-acyltransferase